MVYQSLYISYHGIPWYSTSQQETSHDLSNLIYLFPPEMLNLSSLRGGCPPMPLQVWKAVAAVFHQNRYPLVI